jgi:hypothetical protein
MRPEASLGSDAGPIDENARRRFEAGGLVSLLLAGGSFPAGVARRPDRYGGGRYRPLRRVHGPATGEPGSMS